MPIITLQDGTKINFANNPTPQDVDFAYNKIKEDRARTAQNTSAQAPVQKDPSFGGSLVRGVVKPFARLATNITQFSEQTQNILQSKNAPLTQPFSGGYLGEVKPIGQEGTAGQQLKDILGSGAEIASNFIPAGKAKSLLNLGLKGAIRQTAKETAITGAASGGLQQLGESLQNNDSLGKTALNTVIGTALGGVGGAILGAGGAAIGAAKNVITKEAGAVSRAVDSLESKYNELFTGLSPSKQKKFYNTNLATEAKNNAGTIGRPPQRTLAEDGIIPRQDGRKISTIEQADEYRKSIQPLSEANRAALKEADTSVFPRPITEIESDAIATVQSSKNTPSIKKSMVVKIQQQFADTTDEYGSALSLSVQDELKSMHWGNTKFDMAIPQLDRDVEYAIGKAYQKSIENTAKQAGLEEVAQLNRDIGDRLEAAKWLENLNGKVISGSWTNKLLFTTIGSTLGNSLPGKIFGGLGGDAVARLLVKNSIATPTKRLLLRNLEIQEPEAYKAIIKWMEQQGFDRDLRLHLPSPKPLGTEGNPIITPSPTTYEAQSPQINRESPSAMTTANMVNIPESKPQLVNKSIDLSTPEKKSLFQAAKENFKKDGQAGFAEILKPTKNEGLTTTVLSKLSGRTTVSKQFISDLTNSGDLKQVERDLIRDALIGEGEVVNVTDFANKVKAELLPLKVRDTVITQKQAIAKLRKAGYEIDQDMSGDANILDKNGNFVDYNELPEDMQKLIDGALGNAQSYDDIGKPKYENIALPDELRGNVKNYKENIYESPIKTSAGSTHFSGQTDNYFGHTRIEDMADNKTRRVIEVQSDLYQKGNLERESVPQGQYAQAKILDPNMKQSRADFYDERKKGLAKLQQYNDPTAHFRMVREEIKKASQDGKTKLQFPTGETVMKIEQLSRVDAFRNMTETGTLGEPISINGLRKGRLIGDVSGKPWVITEVLENGEFRALPKRIHEDAFQAGGGGLDRLVSGNADATVRDYQETFNISGKVDTSNPIYKFYEKDVQKYLNKYGGKRIVDDKGVSWIEVPLKQEYANTPVMAFGKIQLGLLPKVGLTLGALSSAAQFGKALGSKQQIPTTVEAAEKPIKTLNVKVRDMHPKIIPAIKTAYESYPELPKGILEAILMKESSAGYNSTNKNDSIGKYAWLGGLTNIAKKELTRLGYKPDFNSIGGVVNSIAKFWSLKSKGTNDVVSVYNKEYSSGRLSKADLDTFKAMYEYYKQ